MCDTVVATKDATLDESVIFGKNSNRHPNEPHQILHVKASGPSKQTIKCTYISIPQVSHTYEVILSKPNWIWGAEMGANEFGVTIGNEAVWTTEMSKEKSLIGMDYVRLGLERGKTADETLEVITDLLNEYGQGGNCGFDKPFYYDNSFIIADPNQAWVLETAGKYWIAEKVKEIKTISNCLTIRNNFDKIHPDLIDYAIDSGKCNSKDDFDFRKNFSTKFMPWAAKGDERRICTRKALNQDRGKITPKSVFRAFRSHNLEDERNLFIPRKSSMASPCLHSSSFKTPDQTTGSLVAHLKEDTPIYWLTGTSSPCLSIFKPIVMPKNHQKHKYDFFKPSEKYDGDNHLWWKHEKLHRRTIQDFSCYFDLYKSEKNKIEDQIYNSIYNEDLELKMSMKEIYELSQETFTENKQLLDQWNEKLTNFQENHPPHGSIFDIRYRWYWSRLNKKAGISF